MSTRKIYKVVLGCDDERESFESDVQSHLDDGWDLQGGVSTGGAGGMKDRDGYTMSYFVLGQVLVKTIEDKL